MSSACLTGDVFDALAAGRSPTAAEAVHLGICPECRLYLEECRANEKFLRGTVMPAAETLVEVDTVPLTFGRYSNCVPLARGGMSSVYRAEAPDGGTVALKVCRNEDALPWFKREIAIMRRLAIPGIPPLLDADEAHLPAYLVTRYFTGGNLAERIAAQGALGSVEVARLAERLATILAGLHEAGIIHRDIKPTNILFDEEGKAWLADLGVARQYLTPDSLVGDQRVMTFCGALTVADSPPLTVSYMSPEQAANDPLTGATDVFSLGVTLYEALTGQNPFSGKTIHVIAAKVLNEIPVEPKQWLGSGASGLSDLIMACLSKDPKMRPDPAKIITRCKNTDSQVNIGPRDAFSNQYNPKGEDKMSKKEALIKAVEVLRAYKLAVSGKTEAALKGLQQPVYKVGIVGQYQVGKSTLINRVFLRDEVLLKEGIGTCTTAVATDIAYGDRKRMEVIPWARKDETVSVSVDGKTETMTVSVIVGQGQSTVIENPTGADIAKATTSSDLDERTELAQSTAQVKLSWPCEALKQYTITDTPGINDPNAILLDNTTYRILPEQDVAILVVDPVQLGSVELGFLRGRMLDQGMSRVLVLISYKPERKLSEAARAEIVGTIKSQLANIGREYIPVRMYCFDDTVKGEGLLNTPDAIESAILQFLKDNVEAGRIEKAAHLVKGDLQAALLQIATEQAFAGMAESERNALLAKIKEKESELKDKYAEIAEGIGIDLVSLKQRLVPEVSAKIYAVGENYIKGFDECAAFSQAIDRLARAPVVMKPDIEKIIVDMQQAAKADVAAIVRKHNDKIRVVQDYWGQLLSVDLHVDGGVISRLPPIAVTIADLVTSCVVLPGGPVIDLIIRFIAGKVPVIRNFMPQVIVMKVMVNTVAESVRREINRMNDELSRVFDESFRAADAGVKAQFKENFVREAAVISKAAEKSASATVSPERKAELERMKASIEAALAML